MTNGAAALLYFLLNEGHEGLIEKSTNNFYKKFEL